jgi:hypothetical protein
MRTYVSALLLLLLMTCWCFAQEEPGPSTPLPEKIKPVKFDEFGDVSEREFGPKLTRYREKNSDWRTRKFIVIYNSYNYSPFKRNSYYVSGKKMAYMRYLQRSHHDGANVFFIDGGYLEKWRTELWVSTSDSDEYRPPIDRMARANAGRPEFIGERMFTSPAALDQAKIGGNMPGPDDANTGEEEETDDTATANGDTDPNGAGAGDEDGADADVNYKARPAPLPENTFSFTFLTEHKEARAVLIFYLDETAFDLAKSRQLIKAQLDEHIARFKLDPAWIKIIYGGYRVTPALEGWAVPVGGPDPEPMPSEKIDDN